MIVRVSVVLKDLLLVTSTDVSSTTWAEVIVRVKWIEYRQHMECLWRYTMHLTLTMTSAQVKKTSANVNNLQFF